jgi:nucleoredoxin
VLATFFDDMKEDDESTLEIVFVSSDNSDADFAAYYGEMPWAALPFGQKDLTSVSVTMSFALYATI